MILKWSSFILFDLFLSIAIYVIYFKDFLLLDKGTKQLKWLNFTPGYQDSIPRLFMMKYGYFPLPKEQNFTAVTWVSIQPDRPVILKGTPNNTRYWSFVFYPCLSKRHTAALPSIDSFKIQLEPDGSYIVTLSPEKVDKNWLNIGSTSGGFISMRNYTPAKKTTITLPSVYWGDTLMVPPKEYKNVE